VAQYLYWTRSVQVLNPRARRGGEPTPRPPARPRATLRTLIPLRPSPRGRQAVHTRIQASPMGQALSYPPSGIRLCRRFFAPIRMS
jgi:hypothetical protein